MSTRPVLTGGAHSHALTPVALPNAISFCFRCFRHHGEKALNGAFHSLIKGRTIGGVAVCGAGVAAQQASLAASTVLTSAGALSRDGKTIEVQVDAFLGEVCMV